MRPLTKEDCDLVREKRANAKLLRLVTAGAGFLKDEGEYEPVVEMYLCDEEGNVYYTMDSPDEALGLPFALQTAIMQAETIGALYGFLRAQSGATERDALAFVARFMGSLSEGNGGVLAAFTEVVRSPGPDPSPRPTGFYL